MPGPLIIDSQVTVNPTAHNVSGRHGRRSAHQPSTTVPLHMVSQDAVMTGIRRPTWSCSPPINDQLLGSPLGCFWLCPCACQGDRRHSPGCSAESHRAERASPRKPEYLFVFASRSCGDSSTLHYSPDSRGSSPWTGQRTLHTARAAPRMRSGPEQGRSEIKSHEAGGSGYWRACALTGARRIVDDPGYGSVSLKLLLSGRT